MIQPLFGAMNAVWQFVTAENLLHTLRLRQTRVP